MIDKSYAVHYISFDLPCPFHPLLNRGWLEVIRTADAVRFIAQSPDHRPTPARNSKSVDHWRKQTGISCLRRRGQQQSDMTGRVAAEDVVAATECFDVRHSLRFKLTSTLPDCLWTAAQRRRGRRVRASDCLGHGQSGEVTPPLTFGPSSLAGRRLRTARGVPSRTEGGALVCIASSRNTVPDGHSAWKHCK
jgi:hypothetical protein